MGLKKRVLIISLLVIICVLTGCFLFPQEEKVSGISVSGSIIMPQSFPGETYEIFFDDDDNRGNGVVASYIGECGDLSYIDFNLPNVPVGGLYYLVAFVPDLPSTKFMTHIGVYGSEDGNSSKAELITIEVDGPKELLGFDFKVFPVGISVLGNLITESVNSITGKQVSTYIDNDTNPENGTLGDSSWVGFDGIEHNFGMGILTAGDYYLYALTDTLRGYYGSPDGDPAKAIKINVALDNITTHKIYMFSK